MSRTSIVSTGRPQTTDLRALDPAVSPLDAFELDTSDADAPVLKMAEGWKFAQALLADNASLADSASALEASYLPTLLSTIFKVGFIYIQLPFQDSPDDLGLPGTWEDVTSTFADNIFESIISNTSVGIIESGSNSDGSWIKFGIGIMIQWTKTAAQGDLYEFSFPTPWYAAPILIALPHGAENIAVPISSVTTTTYTLYSRNTSTGGNATIAKDVIAIGQWKE